MKNKTCKDCKYFVSNGTIVNKGYDGSIKVKFPLSLLNHNLFCDAIQMSLNNIVLNATFCNHFEYLHKKAVINP